MMNKPLSNKQKKQLKGLGHSLQPVVMIADQGLKETVIAATEEALDTHELIKIRIRAEDRDARNEMLTRLCEETGARLVAQTGFTALLFRRNSKKPVIELIR
jgi:RNA-binding protein